MEISCSIIKDLLPLYAEDLTSEDSRKLVDDHLCGCDDCTKELAAIKKAPIVPVEVDVKSLKRVGNSIRRCRTLTALAAIMTLVTVVASVFIYLLTPYYLTAEEAIENVYLKEDGGLIIDYARGINGRSGWSEGENNWGILCHTNRFDWYKGRQKDLEIADLTEEELKAYIADQYDVEECTERQWNRFFNLSEDYGTIRTENGEIIHGYVAELLLNENGKWIQKPADMNQWYVDPSNGDVEKMLWDAGQPAPTSTFISSTNIYAIVFFGSLILTLVLALASRAMHGIGKELVILCVIVFGCIAISTLFVTGGKMITIMMYNWKNLIISESILLSLTAILWYPILRYRKVDKGM